MHLGVWPAVSVGRYSSKIAMEGNVYRLEQLTVKGVESEFRGFVCFRRLRPKP